MINLITDKSSERLKYIIEVIFKIILKTPYTIVDLSVNNKPDFKSGEVVLNYSSRKIPGSFRIPNTGLLFEENIRDHQPEINTDRIPKLYPFTRNDYDLDFDIFSASFYLITEYEKYGKQVFDKHNRYKEDEYFTFNNGLYKEPLLNRYAEELWNKLIAKYSHLQREKSKFDYEITIDVDHPWAYLHKGFTGYAGFIKDILTLDATNFKNRYHSFRTNQDPYDCFDWLFKVCPAERTRLFFLINNQSKYDGRFTADNPHYADLIRKIATHGFECGIHPSYNSYLSAEAIADEKIMLSGILGKEVTSSRQHYLRYHLPETNRALIEAGIKHDYTTAMVNSIGFRNGIATEFNWFDLGKNVKTALILHPTMAMDVSLKNYLGYDAEYAFNQLLDLIKITESVNGKFVLIWHNSNLNQLAGWADWKGLFSELLKYLDSKIK
jgi:hypothetical protein